MNMDTLKILVTRNVDMAVYETRNTISDYHIQPDNGKLLFTLCRNAEAVYGITVHIFDRGGQILKTVKDPPVRVGELIFNPSSLDNALYYLCFNQYMMRIAIDIDVNSFKGAVNVVAVYSEIVLNSEPRRYLQQVNRIKPMYNLPVNISYDAPPLYSGKITDKVYNNVMTLPSEGTIYDIKVLGRHTLELQIGSQAIPIHVSFDGTSTYILDFTVNNPILSGTLAYHAIKIISASTCKDKGLTVSYEVGKMPTDLNLARPIDVQYDGYVLRYFEGMASLNPRASEPEIQVFLEH